MDDSSVMAPIGGLIIGLALGIIIITTNFCTMGAISDMVISADTRRFRSWILAAAVALIGAQALWALGMADLSRSLYLASGVSWFGSIFGGMVFGFGMVLAGGCPSRNLARAGAGDLRAVVTLIVVGLSGYMAMGGLLGPARDYATTLTTAGLPQGVTPALSDLAAYATGISARTWQALLVVLIAGGALLYCFAGADFRTSPRHVLAGLGVGLLVVAGWAVTAMAYDEFASAPGEIASLSFVRPVGDTIEYLARYTAIPMPGFGVATVGGTFFGAMAAALARGRFRVSGFAGNTDTGRNLTGAAMMGVGGVLALGCSVGQGITGVSTLSLGSFLAFPAICFGAVLGVRYLQRQEEAANPCVA